MSRRYALLDLGTNTFHLLVAEIDIQRAIRTLYKSEEFVRLGEEGLQQIGDEAYRRGLEQIKKFAEIIKGFAVHRVFGYGTAAIRQSKNGQQFVADACTLCPMEFSILSGDEEAELIYLGIRQAVPLDHQPVLILDIGGGSTEFIIANRDTIFWKKSLLLGGSLLKQMFHHSEPIRAQEQVRMINYVMEQCQASCEEMKKFRFSRLIGASGSFDTLAALYTENLLNRPFDAFETTTEIPLHAFYSLSERLIKANLEQRLRMKGMPWFRAEMIVASVILTGFIIETLHLHRITRSAYALKEGALWRQVQRESPT